MNVTLHAIEGTLLVYLAFAISYLFAYGVMGYFYRNPLRRKLVVERSVKIAVMIPAYKEDLVILHTAKKALALQYPAKDFDVWVIADSLQNETLQKLKKSKVKLVEVSFDSSTKAKALNTAMKRMPNKYELVFILDADNIAQQDALMKIRQAYLSGYKVIQAHRVAKNLNTGFSVLDGISEEINNHIFSKGHRAVGLSSRLVGSGMAFEYQLFKKTMKNIKAVGGFDKELELKLLKEGHKFEYLHKVKVYDEKVSKGDVFARQRSRWIAAQFYYAARFFPNACWHLISRFNLDYFDKALQMILPPRLLLLGVISIAGITAWFWRGMSLLWCVLAVGMVLAFLISVPKYFFHPRYLKKLVLLPYAFLLMMLAMLKIKGANKTFYHTPHEEVEPTLSNPKRMQGT
ncbi:MAG: glycosyltransferase family 2 protein [Bacteroidota bacterium]